MAEPQRRFTCPACQTVYAVTRESQPAGREPRCQECDAGLPDQEGDAWLHYTRSTVIVARF